MPSNVFDTAGIAIVAYAEVLADGTSPNMNSGVTTGRTSAGLYTVTLPANLGQSDARMQAIVTPKGTITGVPVSHSVDDSDPFIKQVAIYKGSPLATLADSAFNVLIIRTITPPPAGAPA
jgi:hypothetical protein